MSWYDDITGKSVIKAKAGSFESPVGFQAITTKSDKPQAIPSAKQLDVLKVQKAWEIATAPAKQIPVNLFMSYMSGNSLQMIPITMTLMLFTNSIKAILDINKAFQGLSTERNANDITMAMAAFFFFQTLTIGIGIYKLNSMGLIPNQVGDWLSWEVPTNVSNKRNPLIDSNRIIDNKCSSSRSL